MIVEYDKRHYIVLGISLYEYTNLSHRVNDALCIDIVSGRYEWLNITDTIIVDGRLTSNMCAHRQRDEGKDVKESYIYYLSISKWFRT